MTAIRAIIKVDLLNRDGTELASGILQDVGLVASGILHETGENCPIGGDLTLGDMTVRDFGLGGPEKVNYTATVQLPPAPSMRKKDCYSLRISVGTNGYRLVPQK